MVGRNHMDRQGVAGAPVAAPEDSCSVTLTIDLKRCRQEAIESVRREPCDSAVYRGVDWALFTGLSWKPGAPSLRDRRRPGGERGRWFLRMPQFLCVSYTSCPVQRDLCRKVWVSELAHGDEAATASSTTWVSANCCVPGGFCPVFCRNQMLVVFVPAYLKCPTAFVNFPVTWAWVAVRAVLPALALCSRTENQPSFHFVMQCVLWPPKFLDEYK